MAGKPATSITGVNDRLCLCVLPSNHRPRARDNSICRGQFPSFTRSTFTLRHVPAGHRFFICHGVTLGGLLPGVIGPVAFGKTHNRQESFIQQDLSKASSRNTADITVDYVFVFVYIVVPAYTVSLLLRVLQFPSNSSKGKSTGSRSSDFCGTR